MHNKCVPLQSKKKDNFMLNLIGEYECKLDSKSRLLFPAGLKKQLPVAADYTFVLNRGFEKCLVLYPKIGRAHV